MVTDECILNDANAWHLTFTNVPVYADGQAIVYTVSEMPVSDYTSIVSDNNGDFTITYTHVPAIVEIYVSPSGNNNNDGATRETAVATLVKAVELVPEGGIIHLLDGTYKIEMNDYWGMNVVLIDKSISFIGESAENTIIDFEENAYFVTDYDDDGNRQAYDFLTFENITFKDGGPEAVISLFGDVNVLNVTNCIFNGYPSGGLIAFDGLKNLNIANSIFKPCGTERSQ